MCAKVLKSSCRVPIFVASGEKPPLGSGHPSMSEIQKSSVPPQPPAATASPDLEIKDARIIFEPIWEDLESNFGREHLRFPKEIILLGGAPGAGKGTNTAFIAKTRGLTCAPIVMSSLLDTPE